MLRKATELFASRKTAIALLVAAIIASLFRAQFGLKSNTVVVVVLVLLSLNLSVCLIKNGKRIFKRSPSLFLFHIGLLGFAGAALFSALTYYHAYFSLAENQSITDQFLFEQEGPLYKKDLGGLRLTLLSSVIEYRAKNLGLKKNEHAFSVERPGRAATIEKLEYNKPVLWKSYRFYVGNDAGFAPVLVFKSKSALEKAHPVFLPHYAIDSKRQTATFHLPGVPDGQLTAILRLRKEIYSFDRDWILAAPSDGKIEIVYPNQGTRKRRLLAPGESFDIAGGTLTFEELRTWHGFLVDYDPARPYLAFFATASIIGVLLHYALPVKRRKRTLQ